MIELKRIKELFRQLYGGDDVVYCFFSPGRVNLIGEHIDYNGGYVLPVALSIGTYGLIRYRNDNIIQLRSLNADGEILINLSKDIKYDEQCKWSNYPCGVIKYLMDGGYSISGCDILFASNLPIDSGLSSSASIEILTGYMLLYRAFQDKINRIDLARLCQRAENEFIGVNCGIMDQFSIAMGKKDNAILLDCNTLQFRYIPVHLDKYSLIVIDTTKKRSLSDSEYNKRRAECKKVLHILRKHRNIENLCKTSIDDIYDYVGDDTLRRRARHVVTEQKRVLESVEMLKKGDVVSFGRLLTASHESLRNDYEVTGIELDTVVFEALNVKGCIGSRMTGAGFGGCAIALVENRTIDEFQKRISKGYTKKTGLRADFYKCEISDGCRFID